MGDSAIEWTDKTWNPLVGCEYVSDGCRGCYAARDAAGRLSTNPIYKGLAVRAEGELPRFTGEIRLLPERLEQPLHWRRRCMVFVNSMSDLFHPDVPDDFIRQVWETMGRCGIYATGNRPGPHTFQILTKRPQRMAKVVARLLVNEGDGTTYIYDRPDTAAGLGARPLQNVWLGASIESDAFTWRANHVRATPAAVRFLSLEPLLGPLRSLDLTGIDWVIAGGESGPQARPMDPDWVRDLRDRCNAAGVPFLFKQWGEWIPYEPDPQPPFWVSQHGDMIDGHHLPADLTEGHPVDGWWAPPGSDSVTIYRRAGKKAAGRELDGRTWDEYPAR